MCVRSFIPFQSSRTPTHVLPPYTHQTLRTMDGDKILLAGASLNGLYGLQIFSDQDKAAGTWG